MLLKQIFIFNKEYSHSQTKVTMPKWNTGTKKDNADIAALEAITNALLREVKEVQENKPKVLKIVIYETSV